MKRAFCLKFTKFAKNCLFDDFENIMIVAKHAVDFFDILRHGMTAKREKSEIS